MDIERVRKDFRETKKFGDCTTLEEKKKRALLNVSYWSYIENSTENTEYWRGVLRGVEEVEALVK